MAQVFLLFGMEPMVPTVRFENLRELAEGLPEGLPEGPKRRRELTDCTPY